MTTLHDRLADLADDAPPGGPAPDLWDRGRRIARQRRVGTAVIVCAVVLGLVAIGTLDWRRSAPEPAPTNGSVGLPDRVFDPSPWLPTTSRPGQLVAIDGAERGSWTGMDLTLVGISATTGEYAFLDLPDADGGTGRAELAPDGRHIAYWLTGETTGTPNSDSGPITGVAVYDTETGEVTRHWISTAHGLSPDFLAWADADTVVYSAGQIVGGDDASGMDQASSWPGAVLAWSLGSQPRPVPGVDDEWESLEGAAHGRILVSTVDSGSTLVDLAGRSGARRFHLPGADGSAFGLHVVALDASGERVAYVRSNSLPMLAGPVGALRPVPGTRGSRKTYGILDWLDSDTVAVLRSEGDLGIGQAGIYRMSVSTGEAHAMVRSVTEDASWQFATDLLAAPSVHAKQPPSPLDPRKAVGWGALVVLLGGAVLLSWRRSVRP